MNIKRELLRLLPIGGLAGLILVPDDSKHVVLFGVGIVMLATLLAHVIRKIVFPYIDLKVFIDKANDEPLSASIVVASLMYLLATIIQSLIVLLK